LILFTDGLVERNDRPFDIGIDELVEVLSVLPRGLTTDDLTVAILDGLVAGVVAKDDIAVVAIQRVA
jgi:hypothetical protein